MTVVRKGKSENGRITHCGPQDGCCQPRYNLTPSAPGSHSEFKGGGVRNTRAYREHTHGQTRSALYIRYIYELEAIQILKSENKIGALTKCFLRKRGQM